MPVILIDRTPYMRLCSNLSAAHALTKADIIADKIGLQAVMNLCTEMQLQDSI